MNKLLLSLVLQLFIQAPDELPLPEKVTGTEVNKSGVPLLLRIPAAIITKSLNRDFQHTSPVNQILLGTKSTGTSDCKGTVSCDVEDCPSGVSIVCCISGTVESTTCGTNGPAIIHSTAVTNYIATKRLTFDGMVFASSPASATSTTQLTITGIGSSLPRFGGRIVRLVASKRAQETRAEAESIIRSLTEAELCQKIDAEFELRIATMNQQFANKLSILHHFPSARNRIHLHSTKEGVEIALGVELLDPKGSTYIRAPMGASVELWLRLNENLTTSVPLTAILFANAPTWLSTYFSENPMFLKPDDRKWGIEMHENWVVIKLHE